MCQYLPLEVIVAVAMVTVNEINPLLKERTNLYKFVLLSTCKYALLPNI